MDTESFIRKLNEENEAIAAEQAKQKQKEPVGLCPIRVQRERERREKYGTFRARMENQHDE